MFMKIKIRTEIHKFRQKEYKMKYSWQRQNFLVEHYLFHKEFGTLKEGIQMFSLTKKVTTELAAN